MEISYNEGMLTISIGSGVLEVDTGYLNYYWFIHEDEVYFSQSMDKLELYRTKLINNAGFFDHEDDEVFAETMVTSLKLGGFTIISEMVGDQNGAIICLNSMRI